MVLQLAETHHFDIYINQLISLGLGTTGSNHAAIGIVGAEVVIVYYRICSTGISVFRRAGIDGTEVD